jgi:hypothetical protein
MRQKSIELVVGALTLIGVGIAIGGFLVYMLISSGFRPSKISVGPIDLEAPTSQQQTPVVQPQAATSTGEPHGPSITSLGLLRVLGNSNRGVQIQAQQRGTYRFTYQSGAYSTYPIGNPPQDMNTWRTAIFIFRGDRALWDATRLKDESALLRLADSKYQASAEGAEQSAQGLYLETDLSEGDVLTLIAVDHMDSYADNPGQVVIEWFLVKY